MPSTSLQSLLERLYPYRCMMASEGQTAVRNALKVRHQYLFLAYNTIQFRLLAKLRRLEFQLTQPQLRSLHNTLEFGKLEKLNLKSYKNRTNRINSIKYQLKVKYQCVFIKQSSPRQDSWWL